MCLVLPFFCLELNCLEQLFWFFFLSPEVAPVDVTGWRCHPVHLSKKTGGNMEFFAFKNTGI